MSLPTLLNVPRTRNEWDAWSFAHRTHHAAIRQAIYAESHTSDNLFEYQLDPIPQDQIQDWLARNQQSHDDMNQVLDLQGVDLESVDVKDPKQLAAWIYIHWQEHQSAAIALGI